MLAAARLLCWLLEVVMLENLRSERNLW